MYGEKIQKMNTNLGPRIQARIQVIGLLSCLLTANLALSSDATPKHAELIKPVINPAIGYPRRALSQGIEGYVIVRYRIDELGIPVDAVILESHPEGVFERIVLRRLGSARFHVKDLGKVLYSRIVFNGDDDHDLLGSESPLKGMGIEKPVKEGRN
ncbi:MAG: TonB family protein [Gammaproteobacteria bacterium]|nr:TonB family protein [Gammaproteobacteria bacterium]